MASRNENNKLRLLMILQRGEGELFRLYKATYFQITNNDNHCQNIVPISRYLSEEVYK
jgi:hypothetical protein